jgi:hypothetical protein
MVARTLSDLVAVERGDATALRVGDRRDTYDELRTTAWRTAHALRYLGVHEGATVAVAPLVAPPPLLSVLGAASLGARTVLGVDADVEARVAVGPADGPPASTPPGGSTLVYDGDVDDPAGRRWGGLVWSENPVEPPGDVDPDTPFLGDWTHREVLDAADAVVDEWSLDADTSVALRAPADPRGVVAGVVAPLSVGGTVVLPGEDGVADVAVGAGGPESRRIPLDAVRE